jgi:growth factor-regulated tyrosine kinase substrate
LNYSNNNFFILQLKDAREALNALREEHLENKKQQALERERQRQIQLAVKLDDMRQKKQVK